MLVRHYLSVRSCGQVLGTPAISYNYRPNIVCSSASATLATDAVKTRVERELLEHKWEQIGRVGSTGLW